MAYKCLDCYDMVCLGFGVKGRMGIVMASVGIAYRFVRGVFATGIVRNTQWDKYSE